jgi:hypothetical protein
MNSRSAGAPAGVFAAGVLGDGLRNTNTTFRGNQFVALGGVPLVVPDLALRNGAYFTGNTYSTGGGSLRVIWGNWAYTSLNAWRAASGQEP